MSISNSMKIAISEITDQLDKSATIENRLKQAMKLALNHWLITNEDEQFRSAVGAVLLTASEEEKTLITREMVFLRNLSAAITGVSVDFETLFEGIKDQKVIGLVPLWKEVKNETTLGVKL
jgi:hypothetical protein